MQFASITKSLALSVLGFSAATLAINVEQSDYLALVGQTELPPNYELVTPRWKGEWQGINYTIEGNIQQVVAQLEKLHPGSTDFLHTTPMNVGKLESRAEENKNQTYCLPIAGHPYWVAGYWDDLNFGIHYLYWVGGCMEIDAGPARCINIACNNDFWKEGETGIYLCNDNNYSICPNARYLASYAQDLADNCSTKNSPVKLVGGQEFDSDRYNVVVKWGCHGT